MDMNRDWSGTCTFGKCPGCNTLSALRVGRDARMNDLARFECPTCGKTNTVAIVMRGARPSPGYGPAVIDAEQIDKSP